MAKEELIEMNGVVDEILPDSRYRVTLENGHKLVAYTGPDTFPRIRRQYTRVAVPEDAGLRVCCNQRVLGLIPSHSKWGAGAARSLRDGVGGVGVLGPGDIHCVFIRIAGLSRVHR